MLPLFAHPSRTTMLRSRAAALTLSVASLVSGASASTRFWTGTPANAARWDNPLYWAGTVPTSADDAYFNVAQGYTFINAGVAGNAHQISVGRSSGSSLLDMAGGTLTSTDEFFL